MRTTILGSHASWGAVLGTILAVLALGAVRPARAIEVGDPAPEFKLPSTSGADISLSDFRGKTWVFLEFYALDFQPA